MNWLVRALILLLVVASVAAGGIALAFSSDLPGKGCGDRNHAHDRYQECR